MTAEVVPEHYDVFLRVDPLREGFEGRVRIRAKAAKPVSSFSLNASGLEIKSCRVRAGDREVKCEFRLVPEKELLEVKLGEEVSGELEVEVEFSGKYSGDMLGLYTSSWERGRAAVTQFEERFARRAFPCFDHPSLKARFDVTLEVPDFMEAFSNMPPVSAEYVNGWKRVRFRTTPAMPTYLLFFGVGQFVTFPSEDRRVRIVVLPGRERYVDFALKHAYRYLRFFEEYFKVPYPLPKLDLLAVPDFAFGAMENWGAMLFRENLLLYYPGRTTREGLKRLGEVIAHETAHQWFGDLVSPAGWRYIWLNESFATLLSYKALEAVHPDWNVPEMFVANEMEAALYRDALKSTVPIELEKESEKVFGPATSAIIYCKGACFLQMLEDYVGGEAFAKALRRYLEAHKYGSATSEDFWRAVREASGVDVSRFVESWTRQRGYPLIVVEPDGTLRQERFTYLPGGEEGVWVIPLKVGEYSGGEWRVKGFVLDSKEARVNVERPALVNFGRRSFARVMYAREMLDQLLELVEEGAVPAVDRWGLQDDYFALALAGRLGLDGYLELVERRLRREGSLLVASSVSRNLKTVAAVLASRPLADKACEVLRSFMEGVLEVVGWEPREGESIDNGILRGLALARLASLGHREALSRCLEMFERAVRGEAVDPDLREAAFVAAAHELRRDELLRIYETTDSEADRALVLRALSEMPDAGEVEKFLGYVLEKVPARLKFIPIVLSAANRAFTRRAWDWVVENLDSMLKLPETYVERIVDAVAPVSCADRPEEARKLLTTHEKLSKLMVVPQTLERLEVYARLYQRYA